MIEATYIDHMGSDLSVVNAARVSFGKKHTKFLDGDSNLICYLAEHKHMSPFGHAFASFHVKAPIFVARQLVKHKFLRWNEISRRYVDSDPEFYEPDIWRGRSVDKKQGSSGVLELDKMYAHGEYEHIKDVFEKEPKKYGVYKDSLVPVFSLRRTIVWTVLMLLLAVLLSTLVKKQALASEPDPYGPWARLLERVTPTTQESFPSTRCFNLPLEVAAKAACEMEPLHCTILYGIWK